MTGIRQLRARHSVLQVHGCCLLTALGATLAGSSDPCTEGDHTSKHCTALQGLALHEELLR